jgi:8-oxo-dGTP pyrophosphatase MutT (NUDIX family)
VSAGIWERRPAGSTSPHAQAVKALAGWPPPDAEQQELRDLFLAHLRGYPNALSRACWPGHMTASTAVLDAPGRHVLLTLHPKVGRWLQLGGHCEPADATLAAAALREATEESAIAGLDLLDGPVSLDLHAVPCGLAARSPAPRPGAAEAAWHADHPGPLGAAGPEGWLWHLDVQFVAVAPPGARPVRSEESDDLRWWPVSSLPPSADDAVHRLVARACALAG